MALIGEIITRLKVDGSQQRAGLAKAKRGFMKFGKVAEKVNKGIKASFVGITLAAGAFAVAMGKATESIDNLAKVSSKLGVAAEDLQKLRFQAELTGVASNTLDMALQRMVRRVSEAAKGTGEAKDALKELGLDAQRMARLSPDKQFLLISEAMKKVKSNADQVRLSFKLFDSEGVALVNTLNSNLGKTGKLFDSLGISLSKIQTDEVEAFNDAWVQTKVIMSGVSQQIWAGLAPALTKVLSKFNDFLKAGGTGKLINGFFDSINSMIQSFHRLRRGITFMRADFADLFTDIASGFKAATLATTDFIEASVGLWKKWKMGVGDVIEKASSINPSHFSPIRFGPQSGGGRPDLFGDPLSGILKPTKLQANNQAGGRDKIDIVVSSDPNSVVKVLTKSDAINSIIEKIVRQESAATGQ